MPGKPWALGGLMSELTKVKSNVDRTEVELPVVGSWHIQQDSIVCVTRLGSNHVVVEFVDTGNQKRFLFENFQDMFEPCLDAPERIQGQVAELQYAVMSLMADATRLTAKLGVTAKPELGDGSETDALVKAVGGPIKDYKIALHEAKDRELPEIFASIKSANESMAKLMAAQLIPLKAASDALAPAIGQIEKRLFSVDLYAGLSEDIVEIRSGEPAADHEKIHLYQRRHYMDEECLAQYEVGGMEFRSMASFDSWLSCTENFERIFPNQRCVVAFQVRRNNKLRDARKYLSIELDDLERADRYTFLYMRNGERLYCMHTLIDFDAELFPEIPTEAEEPIYFQMFGGSLCGGKYISERKYLDIIARDAKDKEEYDRKCAEGDSGRFPHFRSSFYDYELYSPESLFYDDMQKVRHGEMEKHNRLVLVLQGILDRSPVFHPHPPWKVYTDEGFHEALELVYDSSRALVAGEAPCFDTYFNELASKIEVGSITIGQQDIWEQAELAKDRRRNSRSSWASRDYFPELPHGNPGPGFLAQVTKKVGTGCTFAWARERMTYNPGTKDRLIPCKARYDADKLFNVSAYTPGDFKRFYNDPRTRADYLEWAPLMLAAEEWHASGLTEVFVPACGHANSGKVSTNGQWQCDCDYLFTEEENIAFDKSSKIS